MKKNVLKGKNRLMPTPTNPVPLVPYLPKWYQTESKILLSQRKNRKVQLQSVFLLETCKRNESLDRQHFCGQVLVQKEIYDRR